jgi:uncharacterized membrane protein
MDILTLMVGAVFFVFLYKTHKAVQEMMDDRLGDSFEEALRKKDDC